MNQFFLLYFVFIIGALVGGAIDDLLWRQKIVEEEYKGNLTWWVDKK